MTTWQEQRAELEAVSILRSYPDSVQDAIRACLARLDAAERVVAVAQDTPVFIDDRAARRDLLRTLVAYDALVREQDGGKP